MLFSPLTSMRCAKTILRPGMASYRKSLLTLHWSMMEMCCSCFMDTKYECLRCKIPICNQCLVFEENEDVEGWRAGRSVAYCKACDREESHAGSPSSYSSSSSSSSSGSISSLSLQSLSVSEDLKHAINCFLQIF